MKLDVPRGMFVRAFKDQPTEVSTQLGSTGGFYTFYIDHLGRFFIDLGEDLGIDLPGSLSAGGRIVFGYNSTGSDPQIDIAPTTVSFPATEVFETRSRSFNIDNALGLGAAQIEVVGDNAASFTVDDPVFVLDPGQNHNVTVLFPPENRRGALGAADSAQQ